MDESISKAMNDLTTAMSGKGSDHRIPFRAFLEQVAERPEQLIRSIFQMFHDMVMRHADLMEKTGDGMVEGGGVSPDYDCRRLLAEGVDQPFFADRLFSTRFVNHAAALRRGAQQNKIFVFDGPPGCGKSTFLNNLLKKFEEYANTKAGMRYEAVWRIDRRMMGKMHDSGQENLLARLVRLLAKSQEPQGADGNAVLPAEMGPYQVYKGKDAERKDEGFFEDEDFDIPCPSHDHPLLMIPKALRRPFFEKLFENDKFKKNLMTSKEYEWLFQSPPCTICDCLFHAFLKKLNSPAKVFDLVYAKPYAFNRRLGEGVTVFNPGDPPARETVLTNPMVEKRIHSLFKDACEVRYLFSPYARTHNGIYALMDIKSHNSDRFISLHNIISEGVHKVDAIEESVSSLFLAVMNPEDKRNISGIQSFSDRIEYIQIPYVLDLRTEVEIYRNIFGARINEGFLPRILHNFGRVIIASRLNPRSDALLEWVEDPSKYKEYCDSNLMLLKMEIYTGRMPDWMTEEDRKKFTAERRRKIINESEAEGQKGFSGRDAIKIFNQFYSLYTRGERLITMSNLCHFFQKVRPDLSRMIPDGFMDSLLRLYHYRVLQEMKESLYDYNEEQLSRDIKNYLFALNYEIGSTQKNQFTGDRINITEAYLSAIEDRLLGENQDRETRLWFRKETQKEYTARTLTQEILVEAKPIEATVLYRNLMDRYIYNLKEKVLDPLVKNENFRRAIKDYGTEDFKSYDKRIRNGVTFLMGNLCEKFHYTPQSAKEICMYVIDTDILKKRA